MTRVQISQSFVAQDLKVPARAYLIKKRIEVAAKKRNKEIFGSNLRRNCSVIAAVVIVAIFVVLLILDRPLKYEEITCGMSFEKLVLKHGEPNVPVFHTNGLPYVAMYKPESDIVRVDLFPCKENKVCVKFVYHRLNNENDYTKVLDC